MTSGSIRPKSGKSKLNEKQTKILRDFVDQVDFDDVHTWIIGDARRPLAQAVAHLHKAFLSIEDAEELIFTECVECLAEQGQPREARIGPLGALENSSIHARLTEKLTSHIESLPRKYTLRFELPEFPVRYPSTIKISERIALVTGTKMPLPSTVPGDFEKALERLQHERVSFLEVSALGYASSYSSSPTLADCYATAKHIAFNLVTSGLFREYSRQQDFAVTFHVNTTEETKILRVPHGLKVCLGSIAPVQEKLLERSPTSVSGGLLESIVANTKRLTLVDSEDEVLQALNTSLIPLMRFFECQAHPDFQSICAAIEWYEDSRSTENETFAYLAACIGLEALLGSDETMNGMTNRLSDRYAFLLGKGRAHRDSMAKEYRKVLEVRGKLVHAKAARLRPEERLLLDRARAMLKLVIHHEITVMQAHR